MMPIKTHGTAILLSLTPSPFMCAIPVVQVGTYVDLKKNKQIKVLLRWDCQKTINHAIQKHSTESLSQEHDRTDT